MAKPSARHQCVAVLVDAGRGMFHTELCNAVKANRSTTTEALRWLCRNGFIRKGERHRLAFYEATGKTPPLDGRGRNPKSWVGFTNGRVLGLDRMNTAYMPPDPPPPIHATALAQSLAWMPRPTIEV